MTEGDYGIKLPVTVNGAELQENDTLVFTFKTAKNGTTKLTKTYTITDSNTVDLEFDDTDTAVFAVGSYVYSLDWYKSGEFLCNLISSAVFRVVDKA